MTAGEGNPTEPEWAAGPETTDQQQEWLESALCRSSASTNVIDRLGPDVYLCQ